MKNLNVFNSLCLGNYQKSLEHAEIIAKLLPISSQDVAQNQKILDTNITRIKRCSDFLDPVDFSSLNKNLVNGTSVKFNKYDLESKTINEVSIYFYQIFN